jgi:hypothetical protein
MKRALRTYAPAIPATIVACLVLAGVAGAQGPAPPFGQIGDQLALGQGGGQTPALAAVQTNPEPPLTATPLEACGSGSHPEPGTDGRVPAGSAANGLTCNTTLVSHQGTSGGFKTLRYTDHNGHTCAFYDTALLFPVNAFKLDSSSLGVAVVDMTDPVHPVQTDTLTAAPMMSPHESVVLNQKRGLLAAVLGNPNTYPGDVAIYDASTDCRHPIKDFEGVIARIGHESGFSPDGKTFYAAGTARQSITAIDVTDPKNPYDVWQGNVLSHGLSVSDDGNRIYVADSSAGQMAILDTSQIQQRKPDPQVTEVSRLTWKSASIPQNAIPFTEDGHPYILEFDEYSKGLSQDGDVGAGRIIDIADERHPVVVSNLRLAIDNPGPDRTAAANDPGNLSPLQGYAAHYCNIPSRVDPKVVACSFITSGLRVFDISSLQHPKEVGYFVAPTKAVFENGYNPSNYAMSQPTFDVSRHDVWYTDGGTGFYDVHIADPVWPTASGGGASSGRVCGSRRRFTVTVRAPRGARVRRGRATVAGRRLRVTVHGRVARAVVRLEGLPRHAVQLVFRVTLRNGRVITSRRTYHPCQARLGQRRGA